MGWAVRGILQRELAPVACLGRHQRSGRNENIHGRRKERVVRARVSMRSPSRAQFSLARAVSVSGSVIRSSEPDESMSSVEPMGGFWAARVL